MRRAFDGVDNNSNAPEKQLFAFLGLKNNVGVLFQKKEREKRAKTKLKKHACKPDSPSSLLTLYRTTNSTLSHGAWRWMGSRERLYLHPRVLIPSCGWKSLDEGEGQRPSKDSKKEMSLGVLPNLVLQSKTCHWDILLFITTHTHSHTHTHTHTHTHHT